MKIIILTLLFGLLGYTISKPLETTDATEALVDKWPTSLLHAWPSEQAPLTAYSTHGLNLLTPGLLQDKEEKEKLQLHQPLATTTITTNANFAPYLTPQYLTAQQQYFAFNSAFYNAPSTQYSYITGQQYLPYLVSTLPEVTQLPIAPTTIIKASTTQKPRIKEREPTTKKPQGLLKVKPPKLQIKPQQTTTSTSTTHTIIKNNNIKDDFKNDAALLKAVEKINPEYVIEEIVTIPGKHVYSTKIKENVKTGQKHSTKALIPTIQQTEKLIQPVNTHKLLAKKQTSNKALTPATSQVKVEATGKTSTKGNIPEIPFSTYFLPYFSQNQLQQQQQPSGKKVAALILEPHSKAIVGNGGTAISTPISKAYLKRGVTTNVYFSPESVAIAGVGGKAHAQADLELDLIN